MNDAIDMTIDILNDVEVKIINQMGGDSSICHAARVSTIGAESIDSDTSRGLINFLVKNRHGSPFEHTSMTFLIKAPIFVWREFMRHRIGFSYNEQSGRYMEMLPEFYIPLPSRPLVQVGKAGAYEFVPGDDSQYNVMVNDLGYSYQIAWDRYQRMMEQGIAKEVARMCLPVSIFSSAYVTCNARSMMSFLSLRTKDERSTFPSYPQHEIEMVAKKMESAFSYLYPLTWEAFVANGRVSP